MPLYAESVWKDIDPQVLAQSIRGLWRLMQLYLRQGYVIVSQRMLWDPITYPCVRYLLASNSPYIVHHRNHLQGVCVVVFWYNFVEFNSFVVSYLIQASVPHKSITDMLLIYWTKNTDHGMLSAELFMEFQIAWRIIFALTCPLTDDGLFCYNMLILARLPFDIICS